MEQTTIERDLEIYICNDLKWTFQATQAANKANSVLGRLKKAFKFWNISTFTLLYTCFVRPHLEYAASAWSPHLKGDIKMMIYVLYIFKYILALNFIKKIESKDV